MNLMIPAVLIELEKIREDHSGELAAHEKTMKMEEKKKGAIALDCTLKL